MSINPIKFVFHVYGRFMGSYGVQSTAGGLADAKLGDPSFALVCSLFRNQIGNRGQIWKVETMSISLVQVAFANIASECPTRTELWARELCGVAVWAWEQGRDTSR